MENDIERYDEDYILSLLSKFINTRFTYVCYEQPELKDVEIEDDAFKHIEAIIHSMTPAERKKPSLLDVKRKQRIAKGSGTDVQQVNQLLKQFDQMSKMMKMMQGSQGKNLMRMMGQMKGMGMK